MRHLLLAFVLLACGGRVEDPGQDPTPAPAASPAPAPAPAADPAPGDTPGASTTATRDGAPIYLSMCTTSENAALKVWGEITDPSFEVDEGIIALDVTPASARGTMTCGGDVKVVFAEGRGAEYVADAGACAVELETTAAGQLVGHVKAEYVDGEAKRHAFTVDFTANACE